MKEEVSFKAKHLVNSRETMERLQEQKEKRVNEVCKLAPLFF